LEEPPADKRRLGAEVAMQVAEIRINGGNLAERLGEMRAWLDQRHCEPAIFTYSRDRETLVVRVSFKTPGEAQAFASSFAGRLGTVHREGRR
jgi:hypothetical protein